jgi:hypothetical protein
LRKRDILHNSLDHIERGFCLPSSVLDRREKRAERRTARIARLM